MAGGPDLQISFPLGWLLYIGLQTLNNQFLVDGNGETSSFYVGIWNHATDTSTKELVV